MTRVVIQREARGFSVWSASPYTGSKRDCLAHVDTLAQARGIAALSREGIGLMTIAQMRALYRLWSRQENPALTYREFRATAQQGFDCLMVQWCGMWIGIERDGYTHS